MRNGSNNKHLLLYLFSFAVVLTIGVIGVNAVTANANETEAEIRYLDTDTKEIIYSQMISEKEAIDNNRIHEPSYIFEGESGEQYRLDTEHPGNHFEIAEVWDMSSRPKFYGCCVYYKKGVPKEGETAVKVKLYTNSPSMNKTDLIGIRYIDGLKAGENFVYRPEQRLDSILVYTFHYFIYDEKDAGNCLVIDSLSENSDGNVVTAYYTGQHRFFQRPFQYDCCDSVTGEIWKHDTISEYSDEFRGITPEPMIKTEDGRVYVFDSTDARNLLSMDQFPEYVFPHFYAYYRQQIEIRFDAGEGWCAVDTGTFQRGLSIGILPVPTRAGYLFTGWYTSETGGIQIKDGTVVDFDKNQTLYAGWVKQGEIQKPDSDPQPARLQQAVILKATGKKNGRLKLKWKKVPGADSYEICYAQNAKFKKASKKETKKCEITLKKLKKGKIYYVKVRAYQFDSAGRKVYGKYSEKEKVSIR